MLITQKYEIKSQISYKRLKFNITKYIYQHTKHIMSLILVTVIIMVTLVSKKISRYYLCVGIRSYNI